MSPEGFVHFFIWNRRMAWRKNHYRFLPLATQEYFPAARLPSIHCHTACQNAGMPSAMLGDDRQMTSLTQLLRRPGQMARKKWRQDDVKKIVQKVSYANKRNKMSQNPTFLLQDLDSCRFEPKRRFWAAFQFSGTRNKWMYYSHPLVYFHTFHSLSHHATTTMFSIYSVSIQRLSNTTV